MSSTGIREGHAVPAVDQKPRDLGDEGGGVGVARAESSSRARVEPLVPSPRPWWEASIVARACGACCVGAAVPNRASASSVPLWCVFSRSPSGDWRLEELGRFTDPPPLFRCRDRGDAPQRHRGHGGRVWRNDLSERRTPILHGIPQALQARPGTGHWPGPRTITLPAPRSSPRPCTLASPRFVVGWVEDEECNTEEREGNTPLSDGPIPPRSTRMERAR